MHVYCYKYSKLCNYMFVPHFFFPFLLIDLFEFTGIKEQLIVYIFFVAIVMTCTVCAIIIGEFWLYGRHVIFSSNISQFYALPLMTEYFVNQEKCFYFILLHINITLFLIILISVTLATFVSTLLYCIYGMFSIARYRNKNTIKRPVFLNTTIDGQIAKGPC